MTYAGVPCCEDRAPSAWKAVLGLEFYDHWSSVGERALRGRGRALQYPRCYETKIFQVAWYLPLSIIFTVP